MTSRRDLITTFGAGLLLAGIHPRGLAGESAAPCGPTGRATAGPFYVGNAPTTMDINVLDAPGTPIRHIRGAKIARHCQLIREAPNATCSPFSPARPGLDAHD